MKSAIIGLGMGDEGKGVTTEYLCFKDPKNTIVVRFSGGHQAGHKVIKGDIEHIFSSFGAGTLSGCPTYWSKNCTIEPVAFLNEYLTLIKKGIYPKIYIHPDCPVTTIFDVFANRCSEEVSHGTTGTGFFKTIKRHFQDKLQFNASLIFGDVESIFKKLQEIKFYYNFKETLDAQKFTKPLRTLRHLLNHQIFLSTEVPKYDNIVFEGSQGLMLDPKIGYMPHCTPSDITPNGIYNLGYDVDEIFLVTRCYQTRHGNGPMTNEDKPVILKNNEKETNVFHEYQGKFRTSVLDLNQLIYAKKVGIWNTIKAGTKVNLVVTCMDQMDEYKVTYDGELISLTDQKNFVTMLGDALGISGDLYLNDSPYSNLKKVTK